jgi:hypothetical protein
MPAAAVCREDGENSPTIDFAIPGRVRPPDEDLDLNEISAAARVDPLVAWRLE